MSDPADDRPTPPPLPPGYTPPSGYTASQAPAAPPATYAPPSYGPPPGYPAAPGYGSPAGQAGAPHPHSPAFAPPYAQPGARVPVPPPNAAPRRRRRTATLGIVALVAGIIAAVVAPVAASLATWRVGLGAGAGLAELPLTGEFSWALLTPVRDWVLLGEVSFWFGTAFGIWALAQGIVAIAQDRGRIAGIIAVVLAGVGPILFWIGLQVFLSIGLASGSGITA